LILVVLQCVVTVCCCSVLLQCVAVCCSVLRCVAVCCSVLQCAAMCCSVLHCVAVCCSVLHCVALCCSVLQYVAVCCSVFQCGPINVSKTHMCHERTFMSRTHGYVTNYRWSTRARRQRGLTYVTFSNFVTN